MKLTIKYFAALRECVGKSEEEFSASVTTVEEVYQMLNDKYTFPVDKHHLKVALNEEYAQFDDKISEGDTIVFIPPVAGG